jgi:Ca2+-binding RTX toxin-like protein
MTRRIRSAARGLLIVGSGLILGAVAVVLMWSAPGGHVDQASAAGGCSVSGQTATITLDQGDNSVTLSTVSAGGNEYLSFMTSTTAAAECDPSNPIYTGSGTAPAGDITSVNFAVSSKSTPTNVTVTLDQVTASTISGATTTAFPCALAITGAVGGSSTTAAVTIVGANGINVTVGANTIDPAGCGNTTSSLTGVSSYTVVGTGSATLSALGNSSDPAAVPVTFQAGAGNQVFKESTMSTSPATLDFRSVACINNPCALTANDSGGPVSGVSVSDGNAVIVGKAGQEDSYNFSSNETNVTGLDGLVSGTTSFYGQAGTYTLNSVQNGSLVVAGSGAENYMVNASHTLFQSGTGADTFNVTGSFNNFQASVNGPDTFYASGPSNTLDFSNVGTSSGALLSINTAGAPEPVGSGTLANGHGAIGTSTTNPAFTFLDGPTSTDSSNFSTIIGSTDGNTSFLVNGGTGGLTLVGRGTAPAPGNAVQFLGGSGVAVNLSGVQESLGSSSTAPGFQLGSGQALVGATGGATTCNTTICDTLQSQLGSQATPSVTPPGITTATGPAVGSSTFYAGAAPEIYNFSDAGSGNTFVGGTGQDSFSSAGNQNTYVAGLGSATFHESAPAQGASNTIDFSNVPVGTAAGCSLAPCNLTVNVSGTTVGNDLATVLNGGQATVSTYGFSDGAADFTTLIGASGGATTFDGGLGSYSYIGQGTGNALDFSEAPSSSVSSLTFDVTQQPSPLATLNGSTKETFSGVTNLKGLAGGGTTFIGGSTGGYTFQGNTGPTANQTDFSAQGPSTTMSVSVHSTNTALTPLGGGTVTFSLPGGIVLCPSVPVTVASGTGTASCSTSLLPSGTNRVLAQYTPPSGSGLFGSDIILTPTGSGSAPAPATSVSGVSATPSGTTLTDLSGTTLAATVNNCATAPCSGSATVIAAGTLTFSQAGGASLCQVAVPGGSTTAENVSCTAALPAGAYDVLATYQPANSSVSGSTASPLSVSVSPAEVQARFASVSPGVDVNYIIGYPLSCNGYGFAFDCASATLQNIPSGYSGTVTFSLAGTSTVACSYPVTSTGTDIPVQCSPYQEGVDVSQGQEMVVQFSPNPPPAGEASVSGAGGVSAPDSGGYIFQYLDGSTTSVSVAIGGNTVPTVVAGLPATLNATVDTTTALCTALLGACPKPLPGGQVVFSQAGGGTLCSAQVPSGTPTASVQCSVSLPTAGSTDILATYTSSNNGVVFGSAADEPISIAPPNSTTTSGSYAQNSASGVVADLSANPTTVTTNVTNVTGGVTTNPKVDVTVGTNQVLVGAAPPSGTTDLAGNQTASCSTSVSSCDTITGATTVIGSAGGHNSFVAGSTSEVFGDNGAVGHDAIDLSSLPTSQSSPLTVNVSGAPVTVSGIGSVPNYTATTGAVTDQFLNNGADFTTFVGSASVGGNTTYLAGPTGGYSFSATGTNDSMDFSAAPPINLAYTTATNGTVTGLTGGGGTDTINGLTTIIGSTQGGNHLTAPTGLTGSSTTNYNFTANDDSNHTGIRNTFTGGDGGDTFTSNGNNNMFVVGVGGAKIVDSGRANTVSFAQLTQPVTVDVSGAQVSPAKGNDYAYSNGTDYDFTSFGSTPATIIGSPGGTNFLAGAVGDTFQGAAAPTSPNSLDFSHLQGATSLAFCFVSTSPGPPCSSANQAVLQVSGSSTIEPFQNISVFDGLTNGATDFVATNPALNHFNASGTGNQADYSNLTTGVTVDLSGGTTGTVIAGGSTDYLSGITTVIGASNGGNHFTSGSASYNFVGNGNNNSFTGGPGTNVFSSNGSNNTFTAGTGSNSFTGTGNCNAFTGGSGTDSFSSSGTGNTFIAGSGPDTIADTGFGPVLCGVTNVTNNTIDFGAVRTSSSTPLAVNLSSTPVSASYPNVASNTAQVGTVTYDFTAGGPGFTNILGANSGYTYFSANGATGGYTLTGRGANNTGDFSANLCGISANMGTGSVTLPSGGACATLSNDSISGITKVIGAPQGVNNFNADLLGDSFTAASTSNTLSYQGMSALTGGTGVTVNLSNDTVSRTGYSSDSFSFAPGALTLTGSPGNDTFRVAGSSSVVLQGGGGQDALDASLVPAGTGNAGATIDLNVGSISSPTIGGVTFTPGCATATQLCVTSVTGSVGADTFIAGAGALSSPTPLSLHGNGGTDTLSLQDVGGPATVDMPITSGTPTADAAVCNSPLGATGAVCAGPGGSPEITFDRIQNLIGTSTGGDYVIPGSGSESITETGNPGTLDYSVVPSVSNPANNATGITVDTSDTGATFGGTVTSPLAINVTDTFTDIGTFIGTQDNDTFIQSGPGTYTFKGGAGVNTLDLSGAPAGTTVSLTTPAAGDGCTTGITNNDGTATGSGVSDTFSCMGNVVTATAEYQVAPGQTASINGGGSGTLRLVSTLGDPETVNCGVTVTMPVGATAGTVKSIGCADYNFTFTGISKVYGTPYNDVLVPGSTNATFIGNGGSDGINYSTAAAAAAVNLSGSSYTVPAGYPNSGTVIPANTAIGGNGGTVTLQNVANASATASFNDIVVGGPLPGWLNGGGGNDRFVPTGGDYNINGGTGAGTIDLSALHTYTTLDLGSGAKQSLGTGAGAVTIIPGTIQTAIASPSGSALQAGNGDGYTLEGTGNDWLAAGLGAQTLIASGANDTLVAGIGTDTLQGGSFPVTFIPGQGNDTLTSSTTGNTLSYAGVPNPVQVNLSSQLYSVPPGEPGAGTVLNPNTASGGYGATVNLSGAGITNVVGSQGNDILVTGSGGENINGGGGNDLFVVDSGNNTLTAANGSAPRFLIDGSGSNVINGGGDAWIDYSQAISGASINLQTGTATGGFAGAVETLSGVLNVEGSNFNDVIVLAAANATAIGLNGNDIMQVSPFGHDLLESNGSGNDTFCDATGCNGMTANPAAGSTLVGGTGNDIFYARNGVQDTINGEGGFNEAQIDPVDSPTTFNIQALLP